MTDDQESIESEEEGEMPFFGGRSNKHTDNRDRDKDKHEDKKRLQKLLYLAREDPAPIFDITYCNIKQVPQGIYSLCKVFRKEQLLLNNNNLTSLEGGGDLADLSRLQKIFLHDNKFAKLTQRIELMKELVHLTLDNNVLTELPPQIGNLTHLRILSVSSNRLKSLPQTVGRLKKLNRLNVESNPDLKTLPRELCTAFNLRELRLDADNFNFPPRDVASRGTEAVMRFLCVNSQVEYVSPESNSGDHSPEHIASKPDDTDAPDLPTWEEHDKEMKRLESKMQEASKKQREKFLKNYVDEQTKLDSELQKIQTERDAERSRLIEQIVEDDVKMSKAFSLLMELNASNPERMKQFLEYDRREHDRLLDACRSSYGDAKMEDTLRAMRSMMEEEYNNELILKKYGDSQTEVRRSYLMEELSASRDMDDLLAVKNHQQSILIEKMLTDEEVQKAAVGSLLEKCDARAWSLVQEISLVESHLGKLSAVEMDRKKHQIECDLSELADQRIQLSMLLVDLLDRQAERRTQLLNTLEAMEEQKDSSSNFWLVRYQQLLENVPEVVISSQKKLDPMLANYLLQEGVIHCLPFLVNFVDSIHSLDSLTEDDLKKQGVSLSTDRSGILKAIKLYLEEAEATRLKIMNAVEPSAPSTSSTTPSGPSSPTTPSVEEAPISTVHSETECVVCMEESCAVVFVPCGHLCCCIKCSDSVGELCPMCRGSIERKIRALRP